MGKVKGHPLSSDSILTFMAEYGRAYLASGGPTSRLENEMGRLGRKMGYPSEIFATPTGIFVSCVDRDGTNHTTLSRIRGQSIDLDRLCWLDRVHADVMSERISFEQAIRLLQTLKSRKPPYARWESMAAAFVSGFALSYSAFQNVLAAFSSGVITFATYWVTGQALKKIFPSSIFRDFFGSAVTLVLAAVAQSLFHAPFEALAIGGLVLIVPGLALTNAISELADQNLLSGTSKLMQAILTLLAMGLAYMLFGEISAAMHLTQAPSAGPNPLSLLGSAIGIMISVACFGVIFRVPLPSLPWATLTGLLAWFILKAFSGSDQFVIASYLGSFAVGLVSLALSLIYRIPSQVFSVPGILAMLPGMLALTSFRSFAVGQQTRGLDLAFAVALTSGSIVFGLFTARVPFAFLKKTRSID